MADEMPMVAAMARGMLSQAQGVHELLRREQATTDGARPAAWLILGWLFRRCGTAGQERLMRIALALLEGPPS